MSETTINLGSLPVNRGAFDGTANYYLLNEVTLYGMMFRAKTGTIETPLTGYAPAQLNASGNAVLVNTDKWELIAGTPDIYNEAQRLSAVETGIASVEETAEELEELYQALTQSDIIITDDHTQEDDPEQNKIYREPGTSSYADWMWNGTAWKKMAEYDNGVDDEPTENSDNLVKSGGVFEKINNIEEGITPVALAKNINSWMHTDAVLEDRFADLVRTTAGDVSILSDRGGQLKSIVALSDFKASEFRATGFNLLRDAVAVGDGYFFLVPPMRFGEFGTAAEANGVLFTNAQGENLKPTVYFKPLSEGEPQTTTDGTLCAFTDSHGYRFFTTSEVGFLVVSGITLNQTCAHVGWSRRYDEYIAVDAASDAGGSVPLTAILAALHASGDYAGWMLTVGDAADRIDWLTDGVATWTRNVSTATPTWTTEADPETEGVYIHTATIASMKEGGAAKFMTEDIELNVSGNTISYSDDSETAVTDAVKYELAVPATGTVNVNNLYALNDWGLEKYRNVLGTAATQSNYKQDVKDTVRSLATVQFDNTVRVLTEALVQCREDINRLKSELDAVKEQINS